MDLFRHIIYVINNIIIGIVTFAFIEQFIFTFLFFLPKRKLSETKKKHKIGIFIPARNEESCIKSTIESILESDYPKELFDIYVIANNCTDKTKEIAESCGAIVYEYNDDDPKHKRASYPIKYFFERMLEENKDYDFYIRFDADNNPSKNYLSRMNDAYNHGYKWQEDLTLLKTSPKI